MKLVAAAGGCLALAYVMHLRQKHREERRASGAPASCSGSGCGTSAATPACADAERRGSACGASGPERVLYTNIAVLATMTEAVGDLKDAYILTNGPAVEAVGRMADLPPVGADVRRVDLSGRVVVPGLVNTHHHMFQSLTRCIAKDQTLFGWLQSLYPTWLHLTSEHIYISAKTVMAEMILSGCTLTSDHLYLYPNDCRLDDEIRAAREIGMRFHAARGAMSIGQSKNGLPPDALVEDEDDILEDMARVIRQYHDPSPYAMLRIVLAPCSPFTVTKDLMRAAAKMARESGVFLHTHLAEDDSDIEYSLKHYQQRPGEYIKSVGWTGHDVWHAHCCKLSEEELRLFASTGTGIAHCPSSNCRLASGIADAVNMLDKGVKFAIGVDGSASNDSANVLNEARMAMLMQRATHKRKAAAMSPREALRIATRGGAQVLGRNECGWIGPDSAADFVGWRLDDIGFTGAQHDPIAAIILCMPNRPVDVSIINGRQVVTDGRLRTADLRGLVTRHNQLSASLFAAAKAAAESSVVPKVQPPGSGTRETEGSKA